MRKKAIIILLSLLVACQVRSFHHTPSMAAERAEEFARAAFVEQKFAEAYSLLSSDTKKRLSQDAMVTAIKQLHKDGFPSAVKATDYGPMPGQPAMSIFIHGTGANADIYYRLVMQGTDTEGYSVGAFMRG